MKKETNPTRKSEILDKAEILKHFTTLLPHNEELKAEIFVATIES